MEPLLFGIGLTLLPVYTFASGTIQFAHLAFALLVLLTFTHQRWRATWPERLLLILTVLILVRETIEAVSGQSPASSLIEAAYIGFNTAVLVVVSRISFAQRPFRLALRYGLVAGTLTAVVSVLYFGTSWSLVGGELQRSIGSFNNPNQLGYFALCITSIGGLLYLSRLISRPMCLFLWAAALLLIIASLSRAATFAIIPALVIGVAAFINRDRLSPIVIILSVVLMGALWLVYSAGMLDGFQFVQRLEGTGSERNDTLAQRGYSLPLDSPGHLLFGAGEYASGVGYFKRYEVHSTLWSFMSKYGLIGFCLFAGVWFLWMWTVFKHHGLLGMFIIVAPATIFGITHNGSRFTALWILIGLTFNASIRASASQESRRPPASPYPPGTRESVSAGDAPDGPVQPRYGAGGLAGQR